MCVCVLQAGVGSVMCSYNKINGVWSCENPGQQIKHGSKFFVTESGFTDLGSGFETHFGWDPRH